jgi:hypothetical protein
VWSSTKDPDLQFLQEAMAPQQAIQLTTLASAMGIHRNSLRYYLNEYQVDYKFSELSDSDLDLLVKTFRETKPDSGVCYLVEFLRNHGLRVQKARVKASIDCVDPLGQVIRAHIPVWRRTYEVPRPNALWHIDGHHKLIRWGIVIHGIIDGYCCTVCLLP